MRKEKEEWSLKGKTKGMQMPLLIGGIMSVDYEVVYSNDDIETLRKELIKIIKVHIGEEIDYADPNDIIEGINKLFGKE